jgi:multidrug efflux pump subunit AcrA (membrane-fusion protein)
VYKFCRVLSRFVTFCKLVVQFVLRTVAQRRPATAIVTVIARFSSGEHHTLGRVVVRFWVEEGTLARLLVKVGDTIQSGDIMAEIETDKATMEFEAVEREGPCSCSELVASAHLGVLGPLWGQRSVAI